MISLDDRAPPCPNDRATSWLKTSMKTLPFENGKVSAPPEFYIEPKNQVGKGVTGHRRVGVRRFPVKREEADFV
jgi:hypothetical protein